MAKRTVLIGVAFVAVLAGLLMTDVVLQREVAAQTNGGGMVRAPRFEVDPFWPKPLPNHWLLGAAIGVWVDERDHIWIIHRSSATLNNNERGAELNPPTGECCKGAPPVLEFDAEGTLVNSWGGPGQGYEWPQSNHGIFVDHKGNVWIGGNGAGDSHVLKFTRTGKFIAQYGKAGIHKGPVDAEGLSTYAGDSNDQQNFGRVAKIFVDPRDNEAYIADGYLNKRVAVLDADTGKMKRYWGAYGNKPDDRNLGPYNPDAPPAQQFRNPVHCADVSNDGFVYVCDRVNTRLQVFTKEGKFVKENWYARRSLADGSVWDVAFSKDPQQTYIFMADGRNQRVRVIRRDTLEELTAFGDGGRYPGQFFGVHSIAIDSKNNLYTTETYEGKRLQKFVYKGVGNVPRSQGVAWPRGTQ
jgi:DNA-binding beta-propeller fold protein YncE